ncbi:MAG TPA: DUF3419 family protein [Thermoplasmatales archaeon]|nr:DUF3419 family protein [Thermoplasmatales archaeon]
MNNQHLLFRSPIDYAQGWEDHRIVEEALKVKKGDVLVCILASGDNVLNLLLFNPSKIYAFDVSLGQIHEMKLKLTGLRYLNHQEFITLLGYRGNGFERIKTFKSIEDKLDVETKRFWKKNIRMIKKGLAFQGWWEKYLSSRRYIIKLLLGKDFLRYINSKSLSEREEIFEKRINRKTLRFLSKIFLGKVGTNLVLLKGPSIRYLPKDFDYHKHLWNILKHFLVDAGCKDNPYLYWFFTGKILSDERFWQPYLQKENYLLLKKNLSRVKIIHNDIGSGLRSFESNKVDKVYASDIFDWMNHKQMETTLSEMVRVTKHMGRILYFILNYDKGIPEKVQKYVKTDPSKNKSLWKKERVGLYSNVYLLEVNKKIVDKKHY